MIFLDLVILPGSTSYLEFNLCEGDDFLLNLTATMWKEKKDKKNLLNSLNSVYLLYFTSYQFIGGS